jgi:hypothetical protein
VKIKLEKKLEKNKKKKLFRVKRSKAHLQINYKFKNQYPKIKHKNKFSNIKHKVRIKIINKNKTQKLNKMQMKDNLKVINKQMISCQQIPNKKELLILISNIVKTTIRYPIQNLDINLLKGIKTFRNHHLTWNPKSSKLLVQSKII